MKEKGSAVITSENFEEHKLKVFQLERRREKLLVMRKWGDIAGGTVFFVAELSAIYGLADRLEMPTAPPLQFLSVLGKSLYSPFLPEGCSAEEGLLFSVIAAVLIGLAVHLLTALAVGRDYSETPRDPLEGSDSEQAAALCARCKAAGAGLPPRKKLVFAATFALVVLIPILLDPENFQYLVDAGLLLSLLAVVVIGCILLLMYTIPYAVVLWLSGFLYRIRRETELEEALDTYARLSKEREEEEKRAEEERRRQEEIEQDRLQGDELYRQAIAGGQIDEELVRQAAELGCRPACLYLGRQKMEAWAAGPYTKKEKAGIAEEAKRYFRTAALEEYFEQSRIEAQFGYLMFQVLTESGGASKWEEVLSQLREIQSSGMLPEQYRESCAMLIDSVIELADTAAEKSKRSQPKSDEPVVKRCYCRFLNGSICTYYSGSYNTAHCDHISDPGQCSAALLEHGLMFEFE